jgi:hypothetical protein
VLAIYLTARLAFRLDSRVVFPATVLATLLVGDAWFDIITATTANDPTQALILVLADDLPAAAFSLYVACRVGQRVRELAQPGHVTGPQPPGPDLARKHPALPCTVLFPGRTLPQE